MRALLLPVLAEGLAVEVEVDRLIRSVDGDLSAHPRAREQERRSELHRCRHVLRRAGALPTRMGRSS